MKNLEEAILFSFKDKNLLIEALTHPSLKRIAKNDFSYERLEFLGDKALGLIIGEYLFKTFKEENEGQISKRHASLICGKSLAKIAGKIDLGNFIKFATNQELEGGKESENILENAMEALIGAIFLDAGIEVAKKVVLNLFKELLEQIEFEEPEQDSKSKLQEWFQKKYKQTPTYNLIEKNGNLFKVSVIIEQKEFFGEAGTIKMAEKLAATNFLNSSFFLHKKR